MVLCTFHIMISTSPTTLSTKTLRLMSLCRPNMSASYSTMLFVHSNSKRIDITCFLCFGSIKIHPAPKPSYVFDPSKYMIHNSSIHGPFNALVQLLLLLLLLLFLLLPMLKCVIHVSFPSVWKGRRPTACLVGLELVVRHTTPALFPRGSFRTWSLRRPMVPSRH